MDEQTDENTVNKVIKKGEELIKQGNTEFLNAKINEKDLAVLIFTSGTTSASKAVMLSQYNIAKNIHDMLMVEKFKSSDVNIAFLPYHHAFGSTGQLVMLASGIQTVFPDGLKYIGQNLKEYGVTVFVGVPKLIEAIYDRVNKEIEKQGKTKLIKTAKLFTNFLLKCKIDVRRKAYKKIINNLGGLRFVISGAAALNKDVANGFYELGIETVQGYGLTETAPVVAAENYKYRKSGSIGFPMPSVDVEIVNKDENGIGELKVKGPNVMMGYYQNEKATKEVIKDGWFYTGDLGYIDNDGFLFLTGREKDVIVMKNGKKVFPEELEVLVNNLPEVEESFIYGMAQKGDKNDPMVSVKIVYNKDAIINRSEDELYDILWNEVKEINKTLPPYKYIKNMIITDEPLIKTTTHKIKRKEELALIEGK